MRVCVGVITHSHARHAFDVEGSNVTLLSLPFGLLLQPSQPAAADGTVHSTAHDVLAAVRVSVSAAPAVDSVLGDVAATFTESCAASTLASAQHALAVAPRGWPEAVARVNGWHTGVGAGSGVAAGDAAAAGAVAVPPSSRGALASAVPQHAQAPRTSGAVHTRPTRSASNVSMTTDSMNEPHARASALPGVFAAAAALRHRHRRDSHEPMRDESITAGDGAGSTPSDAVAMNSSMPARHGVAPRGTPGVLGTKRYGRGCCHPVRPLHSCVLRCVTWWCADAPLVLAACIPQRASLSTCISRRSRGCVRSVSTLTTRRCAATRCPILVSATASTPFAPSAARS